LLKKFSFIILLALGIAFPSASMGATPRHTLASAIDRALKANPTMVAVILKKIGWTCQKPVVRATQRDEEASKKWLQEKWPEIKKSR